MSENNPFENLPVVPDFPTEVTVKAVFRYNPTTTDSLKSLLEATNINGEIGMKSSSGSKFQSFTISAVYPSQEMLDEVCNALKMIDDFYMLF